jgi:hypothetical protein
MERLALATFSYGSRIGDKDMKTKIDWKHKLTSRKFWAAIVGFVSPMIMQAEGSPEQATRVTALL